MERLQETTDIRGEALTFLGLGNRYSTTFYNHFKSFDQTNDTYAGDKNALSLAFSLSNEANYFKCEPTVTFFTILTQIGGILGLSKVFVLSFLYNERVFEKKLQKTYEGVGGGGSIKTEERYAKVLNQTSGEDQETPSSALVEEEVAEDVKFRELFSFEKFAEMYKKQ